MRNLISLNEGLSLPELPQRIDGIIDIQKIQQDTIIVIVERYYNISTGDTIKVRFGTIVSTPYIVLDGPSQGPMYFHFLADNIPNGNYDVSYTSTDISTNSSNSPSTQVVVINSNCNCYPAPTFPDYPYNIIGIQSAIQSNGVTLRASYEFLAAGDLVTFKWRGTDSDGIFVPDSYFTKPITVQAQNVADRYIEVKIPLNNILVLNNFGNGYASYDVSLSLHGGDYSSSMTSALVVWSDIDHLQISVTNGAPRQSKDLLPYLLPKNTGTVFGPPGALIRLAATNGAVVADIYGFENPELIQLDEFGLGMFSVYTTSSAPDDMQVSVVAETIKGNLPSARTMSVFCPYRVGSAGIKAYAFTTKAPADGVSPCSIYIVGDGDIQFIDVFGTGNFLINGRSNSIRTTLNSDLTCTVNIVSEVAQNIEIGLKNSCSLGAILYISIEFTEPLSLTT